MGMKQAMLGEVADRPLRRTALVRRLRRRHPLARWQGQDQLVDKLRREGLLSTVASPLTSGSTGDSPPGDLDPWDDGVHDPREDPTPFGLSAAGRSCLRDWLHRPTTPGTFRDDLLVQIAASEEDDLAALEAIVRERLATVTDLAVEADDLPKRDTVKPEDWCRRRMRVARTLDLSVLDGLARGLRRAHTEIVSAMDQEDRGDR
jgi:hypothetical protein